jgi:hypothetical protein
MKKRSILITALIAVLALSAVTAFAAPPTKVNTKVSLSFSGAGSDPYDPYGEAKFTGKVKAKKGCKKGRKVVVRNGNGASVGGTKSAANGSFSVAVPSNFAPGSYQATAKKKKLKKGSKKITCKRGTSNTVVVP